MEQQFIVECAACGGSFITGPSEDAGEMAEQARVFMAWHICPATPDPAEEVERQVDARYDEGRT